jgi:hypothetical protein
MINGSLTGSSLPGSYYVVQLGVGDFNTIMNSSVTKFTPIDLTYNLVLNTTNTSDGVDKLPDFNATINLKNKDDTVFMDGLRQFHNPITNRLITNPPISESISAKNPWNDALTTAGEYTLNAIVDNEDLSVNITAIDPPKQDTSIGLDKVHVEFIVGSELSGIINLTNGTDGSGVGIPDATLNILINGTSISNSTTNGSGEANLSNIGYLFSADGDYSLTVNYTGNGTYNPTIASKIIKVVDKLDTIIGLDKVPKDFKVGNLLTGVINLTDINDEGVPDAELEILINGTNIINITNGSGEVDLSKIGYVFGSAGVYNLTIEYLGNDTYNPTIASKDITVNKQSTSIGLDNVKTPLTIGDELSGVIKLTYGNGMGIPDATLEIFINGISIANSTTNGIGEFDLSTLNYKFASAGEYNLTVKYAGNETYTPSNNIKNITVNPNPGPNPPGPSPPSPGPNPDHNGSNSTDNGHNSISNGLSNWFGHSLPNTGFPLIILAILSVLGLVYWRRK